MSDPQKFRALQRWSDEWWPEDRADNLCDCGREGEGPRHHAIRCPFLGWAWEQKARHLLKGGEPGDDPSLHLLPTPSQRAEQQLRQSYREWRAAQVS